MTPKTVCTNLNNVQVGDFVTIAYDNGDERHRPVKAVGEGTFCVGDRVYLVMCSEYAVSNDYSGATAYAMFEGQEDEL